MANRTDKSAVWVHGTNPQYLIEKIIRSRIYGCLFWKSECFGLDAETIVERAVQLNHVGGCVGANLQPTPFICLTLKLLQLQPEKEIVLRLLEQPDFKYLRALAAFYLRLVGSAYDIYRYLEPFYNDYRKIRFRLTDGSYVLRHMDEFVDELLREERVCDIILPRLLKRSALEESGQLEIRRSALEDDLEEEELNQRAILLSSPPLSPSSPNRKERSRSRSRERGRRDRSRSRSRERERETRRDRSRSRSRNRSRERNRERGRDRDRERRKDRSRSRDRRSRSRSRSRSHERRERKRSRSRSYERRERRNERRQEREKDREADREGGKEKEKVKKEKEKEKPKPTTTTTTKGSGGKEYTEEEMREIEEQNVLRAKLGLKPLKL